MESASARALAPLLALLVAPLVASLVAPPTQDPAVFEAAFQGRCGARSPCEQLCRELHDGTYECGCRPGFLLNVDGYSCQELNSTSRPFDSDEDTEEDVLYQKDASFSAELDVALLPSTDNRPKSKLPTDADLYTLIEDNHIYNQKHIEREVEKSTTALPKYISNDAQDFNDKEDNYTYAGERYKQLEGLNNLISEGISRNDINMITDDKTRLDEEAYASENYIKQGLVTTLGPSLEQKVPHATSSPLSTAALAAGGGGVAAAEGEPDARQRCPLGRTGPHCQHEARIQSPRFSGGSWLALPALRGAYKRVRLRMRVRPERARGVLLLTGERDDLSGDYLALLLRDSHLELRFDCGSGAGVLRSPEPVRLGRWNTVSVYRHRWDARLRLNNGRRLRGRSKDSFPRMTFRGPVWVGGGGNTTRLAAKLSLADGLVGCVDFVRFNSHILLQGLFSRMTFREPVWVGGGGNTTGLAAKLSLADGLVGCVDFLRINSRTYRLTQDATAGVDVSECAPTLPPWQASDITTSDTTTAYTTKNNNNDNPTRSVVTFSDHTNLVPVDRADHSMPSDFGSLRYADSDVVMRDSTRNELVNSKEKSAEVGERMKDDGDRVVDSEKKGEFKIDNEDSCSCVHGGACVRGVCLCPLGYAGDSCQITLDLKVPRFNGSSYLRLPGLGNTALSWLNIEITLKATSGTGLVMYESDRASGAGDFFSLQLRDYYVEFAFDLGSGIALVRSAAPLRRDTWHRVSVSRSGKRAQLRVRTADGAAPPPPPPPPTRSVTAPGRAAQLSLRRPLLLGGAPRPLPPRLALDDTFSGCIRELIINEEELTVVSSALGGVNVDNCEEPQYNDTCSSTHANCKGSLESIPDIHKNESINDIHHSIVPKKGFRMKHHKIIKKTHSHLERYRLKKYMKLKKNQYQNTLERSNDIVTESPNERSFKNLYNDETYMQVKYTDTNEINWSDTNSYPSFTGKDSFIHIDDSETMKRLLSFTLDINIRFKSVSSNGLLVWSGRNNMAVGDDFLALAVENSMLVFRYDLGSGEVVIVANHTVDDGLWHRARATRNRQAGVLEVDGLGSVGKVSPGKLKQLNTENGLYIGGMPSIASNTLGKYASGIKGCISQISLSGDFDIPLTLNKLPHTITNNVGRCLP